MRSPDGGPQPSMGGDVVVSGTASDSHTWNLVYLQLLLEEMGHRVVNLGPCVPADLLAVECAGRRPDLVVLSSVNGHGYQDGVRAAAALRAVPVLAGTPVVIGGKLGTAGREPAGARALRAAGVDAVFDDEAAGLAPFRSFVAAALSPTALRGAPGSPA